MFMFPQKNLARKGFLASQASFSNIFFYWKKTTKLEQLECLHSENTPAAPAPWLPVVLIHIGSQVKTRQNQGYKFKKIAKY